MTRNTLLWIFWLGSTLIAGGAFAAIMYVGGSRELLLVGETTSAHHQIELACGACHTADFAAEADVVAADMSDACLSCHEEELDDAKDSHPMSKFTNPRNAARREQLDALYCTTCHMEHVEDITEPMAVTLPLDYCSACHQDIGEERATHVGLTFETCASAGCHNYHDNTALYEDFLLDHANEPAIAMTPIQPLAAKTRARPVATALASDDPVAALAAYLEATAEDDPRRRRDDDDAPDVEEQAVDRLRSVLVAADAEAPPAYLTEEAILAWDGSGHALGGVNCAGCHAPATEDELDAAEERGSPVSLSVTEMADRWIEEPGIAVCETCHENQAETFKLGRHGMRLHPELPEPRPAPESPLLAAVTAPFRDRPLPPMSVAEARLPMKDDVHDRVTGNCGTCHQPHAVDLEEAAVEACVSCHDDEHTQAYFGSPHHELWQAETSGLAEPGTGVTCADCHMPKVDQRRRGYFTNHNQNATLRPNEKMIRPVCMSCHSLEFAIDALADADLVERNFNGQPSRHVESIDWAVSRTE